MGLSGGKNLVYSVPVVTAYHTRHTVRFPEAQRTPRKVDMAVNERLKISHSQRDGC